MLVRRNKGGLVLTVLYEDVQGLGVAVFSSDRQRCHPMAVSGIDFSSMSEELRQNICAAHLVHGWNRSTGQQKGALIS